jgi:hypothetical protein
VPSPKKDDQRTGAELLKCAQRSLEADDARWTAIAREISRRHRGDHHRAVHRLYKMQQEGSLLFRR